MPADEFRELVEDIKRQGVLEPVVMLDGMVLDGWHRYQACLEVGVETPTKPWRNTDGMESAFAYAWGRNALRRHLTRAQRIDIVQKTHPELWAKVGNEPPGPRKDTTESVASSASQLADLAGVRPQDIRQAKRLETEAPDLYARTAGGERGLDLGTADAVRLQRKEAEKARDQRESKARQNMEWKNDFVAQLLRKVDAIKEIPKEVREGLKFEKFSPEAKPFLDRRLESAIRSLIEAQEELR